MELREIRTILSGLKVSVETKRQAWIEYGGLLAQCPYTQRNQVGKWVADQGLDFVADDKDRSASKRLFNISINDKIKFIGCSVSHPRAVIAWLQDQDLIPVDRKDRPDKPELPTHPDVRDIYDIEVKLRNAFNSDDFEMRDGFTTTKPIGSDWNDAITERIFDMNDANHGDVLGYADGYQLVVQYKKVRVAVSKVADALGTEVIS